MRTRQTAAMVMLALFLVACAATPIQREYQYAGAISATNDAAVTALDFGIIDADTGEVVQGLTRVATADLKRAIAARRSGASVPEWQRIIDIVLDSLQQAAEKLGLEEVPQ